MQISKAPKLSTLSKQCTHAFHRLIDIDSLCFISKEEKGLLV